MKFVAYSVNEFGANLNLDVVETACSFEKIQGTENNNMLWNHTWWGYMMLPELRIEEK